MYKIFIAVEASRRKKMNPDIQLVPHIKNFVELYGSLITASHVM